ncbi:hypothetical protein GPY61_00240 [Massilia sp. NEAU-DD11]|uniref:DUF3108 domain-containing protein n=1 Tax=Massilia cellulosiltytica TaxID=2683234 RepID=A0A7X3K611_9BURK|nr:hypothetical protein [Telluria cellulosilytica]MVW58351.1 hypothetical protein [Telluria cellulosilytica]
MKYALPVCMVAAAVLSAPLSSAATLDFDHVFSTRGEPAATHFEATYLAGGAEHHVEVWRDGERRIRRRTDDKAESFALRTPGSPDYRLSVLDLGKKIRTDIDRDNLYRIGQFTDWFDLGHGLHHPKGGYRLVPAASPHEAARAIGACEWVALVQGTQTTHVCWSTTAKLPLLIQAADGRTVWRVTHVDHKTIPDKVFAIQDAGFIRNDANADIERD